MSTVKIGDNFRNKYYSQEDKDSFIYVDPVADARYKYSLTNNSFGNGLSSMVGSTIMRIPFIEGSLDTSYDSDEVVYDFNTDDYLKPLPGSVIVLNNTYKNTDILLTKNVKMVNGFVGKGDLINKSGLIDKEVYENLGLNIPMFNKTYRMGSSLATPEYDFEYTNDYLEKFRLDYNKPYMPMFFGYREMGYNGNYLMPQSINKNLEYNAIESIFYFSNDWTKYITLDSGYVDELGSVGSYMSDRSFTKFITNVHYRLSLLSTRSHKRNSYQLADKNYSYLEDLSNRNDIVKFDNMTLCYPDGTSKQVLSSNSNEYRHLVNETSDCDFVSMLKYSTNYNNVRVNSEYMLELLNINNKVFPNHIMMDVGSSLDVREYMYIRDASSCGYIEKELERIGDSYITHHGMINIKQLVHRFYGFKDKFFSTEDLPEASLDFNNNDSWDDYISLLGTDPLQLSEEDSVDLPVVTHKLVNKLRSKYPFTDIPDLCSSYIDIYPYTGLPILSKKGVYNSLPYGKVINEYVYEGSFCNVFPMLSSPVNNTQDFSLYINNSFRGGLGLNVVTNTDGCVINGYEGKNFINTTNDSYTGVGNGTSYMLQRLKSRLGLALSVSPSYSNLSYLTKIRKNAFTLGKNESNNVSERSVLDPIDIQNYIYSSELAIQSGYNVDNVLLPTERFNNIFINYDSELTHIKNLNVKIDVTSKPVYIKVLSNTDNDIRYELPHIVTGNKVGQFRKYETTNKSSSSYVNTELSISKAYSDYTDGVIPFGDVRTNGNTIEIIHDTQIKFDNIVEGYYSNGCRVYTESGGFTQNDMFKNTRYESITGNVLVEENMLSHTQIEEGMKSSFIDMENKKGSNSLIRDNINLHNFKLLYNSYNGCQDIESGLSEYSCYEDTIDNYTDNTVYNFIKPNKDIVSGITKDYIK